MVSRQKRRPNLACTKSTRRRNVQRGFTAAPATGGLAAGVARREPARQARQRYRDKGGAATAALIGQRRGAVFVVGVQPTHHGLWVAACAHRHLRSAGAFSDLVQSQETLAAAGMRGIEGQLTQIRLRLAPTVVVNL